MFLLFHTAVLEFLSFTAELRHLRFSIMQQRLLRLRRIRSRQFYLDKEKFPSFQEKSCLPNFKKKKNVYIVKS